MSDTPPDLTPYCPACGIRVEKMPLLDHYPLHCPQCQAALPPFRYPLRRADPRQAFRPQEDERRQEPQ